MSKTEDGNTIKKPITIILVDDRSSFIRGENYPHTIYLSTVLRWTIQGNHIYHSGNNNIKKAKGKAVLSPRDPVKTANDKCMFEEIIRNNDSALSSVGDLLADGIESGAVTIFSTHSRSLLGGGEKNLLVRRLRTMNRKNNFSDLAGIDDIDYSLDGRTFYDFVLKSSVPAADDFQKGGIWLSLAWDVPKEWRTPPAKIETSPTSASLDQSAPAAKMAMLEAKTSLIEVDDIKEDHCDLDGSPTVKIGTNSRKQIVKWVEWQARQLVKEGDTTKKLADKIWLEANRRKIASERGTLSKATIIKMLPAGLTGGRSRNGRKTEK